MRLFVLEFLLETVELPLLGLKISRRRLSGLGLQGFVHELVLAVLLRPAGLDQLRQDAKPNPPGREPGESCQGIGRTRHAVIGADSSGQPIFPAEAREYRFGVLHRGGREPLAPEQIAARAVGDGEGITVNPVLRLKLALEVGAPDIIRGKDRTRGFPDGRCSGGSISKAPSRVGLRCHRPWSVRAAPSVGDACAQWPEASWHPTKGADGALPGTPERSPWAWRSVRRRVGGIVP